MSTTKVYSLLVLIMLIWGVNVSWMKVVIAAGDPLTIQGTRVLVAAIVIFIILKCMRQQLFVKSMPWKYILLGSFFGVICHHGFFALGIDSTTATKAGIISGMSPLFTAFVAVLFRDTVMTRAKFLGFALGASGVLVAVVKGFDDLLSWEMGDIFMFLSFFLQAFSFLAIRKGTRTMEPMLMTAWMQLVGACVLVFSAVLIKPSHFTVFAHMSGNVVVLFLLSAVLSTSVGHTIYNFCIKQIGAAESAIFANLTPIFSLLGSALLLGEVITMKHIMGCLLIIFGVLVGTGSLEHFIRKRHQHIA